MNKLKDDKSVTNYQKIIKENEKAIHYFANLYSEKYYFLSVEKDDLIQEAYLGILRAFENYEVKAGASFNTYLNYYIEGYMKNYVRSLMSSKGKSLTTAVSLSLEIGENLSLIDLIPSNNPYEYAFLKDEIINFKHGLNLLNSLIFELFCNNFSYQEIATLLSIPKKKVDNIMYSNRKKAKEFFEY